MNRLKELRIEKGLLQSHIAEVINKSDRTVGFYETGKRDMGTETLAKLADFFDVSIDYLLGISNIRKTPIVELSDIELAFASGLKGLNKKNQEIAKNIIEGLLAKQNNDIDNNNGGI